ncbi:hypothetical protein J7F01_23110 [Streptomyces sp. ISL-22]|uniref:hypothetical protein n=1 Tax=unclassified Streptomyces TaxID=2593676 RepID=UPI001BE699D3|nr:MULTISPECIES: hypothetical protein [unclassified Streptomyces]MBT2420437.1 hypothetical protein [Streptomyces sp. ISL-24]MBT2435007.1 hypothetical protein [Streptomyces sp. ISL-22]
MDKHEDSARQLAGWADGVLERLAAQEELDGALLAAMGRSPSIHEETLARMAEAVRSAALGLGPEGCALAAGIPERLLLHWQLRNPSFAAAMASATALARSHAPGGHGRPAHLSSAALSVVLKAIRAGARHTVAAAVAGVPLKALNGLRRKHPEVDALILAARRARPKRADRRGVSAYEHGYRLVRVDDSASPTPPGSPADTPSKLQGVVEEACRG